MSEKQLEIPFEQEAKLNNIESLKIKIIGLSDISIKEYTTDYLLIDDIVKNNTKKSFKIVDDNDEYREMFIDKKLVKRSFFNRLKHAFNVLRNRAVPVYYFEDIDKYYTDKTINYINYKEKV